MYGKLLRFLAITFLVLISMVILFPYILMLITAFKTRPEVFAFPPHWLPESLFWGNFKSLFTQYGFGRSFMNSVIAVGGSTVLSIAIAIPAAYAVARLKFVGRRGVIYILLITQMFSPIVIIVGLFKVIVFYHLLDSLWSLVFTFAAFNLAFNIWMLASFFETIPAAIEEAAWIDGLSRLGSIMRIFVPLAGPGISVAFLFSFVAAWNDLVLALSFLRSSDKFTVTLNIFNLVSGRYTIEWQVVMAGVLIATIPVVWLFGYVQKYFVAGFATGAVK